MSCTASTATPELTVSCVCLRKFRNGSQSHLVSIWSSDSGDEVAVLELKTFRGEIVDVRVAGGDQLKLY
jgi:hypothetical protein